MTAADVQTMWERLQLILRNARKQILLVPEDRLDFSPGPGARTARELILHLYGFVVEAPEAILTGKFTESKPPVVANKDELLQWLDSRVAQAGALYSQIKDEHMQRMIDVEGHPITPLQMLQATPEEVAHHRGQLTVYLRVMGLEPVNLYDFS